MAFHVGQKVVCVDNSGNASSVMNIGDTFTVVGILSAHIIEIDCRPINSAPGACGWFKDRFRPLTDRKPEISFTEGAPKDSEKWDNRKRVKVRS